MATNGTPFQGPFATRPRLPSRAWRIALVDDDESIHASVRETVQTHAKGAVLRCYANATEALHHIPADAPDVVLMDIRMPGLSGIECTRRLKVLLPRLRVVMYTACSNDEPVVRSVMAGACGYLVKPVPPPETLRAIACAAAGSHALCPRAVQVMMDCFHRAGDYARSLNLTPREEHVAACLLRHLSDKEISDTAHMALTTVHTHLRHIFHKTGAHSRAEALRKLLGGG